MKNILYLVFTVSFYFAQGQSNTGTAIHQEQQQLWGTWSLISVENTNADGSKISPYGEHPVGMLIFTSTGEYAIQILKANRSKVAANDKDKATPEENAMLVRGNNSHFGTYTIDENKQVIVFNIQHAFYPNWEGIAQVRTYSLKDNLLTYTVTTPTNGGAAVAKVVWRKNQHSPSAAQ
ncbi:lipocalin-like domain-containing protein [Chitinophaga sp. G-6-1-13]|uniref:Lipocalin-like domain-containing protein n=1 Tax=Chitinophaga fulva TaxID=2728842 RepID=A0A848GUS8_9BACT|nr:lipocalin-like domain-containing protein [Chitinophaga fulva]NML40390.1 lipocalin-like domain-containing protein [Chitinophaga fulva]